MDCFQRITSEINSLWNSPPPGYLSGVSFNREDALDLIMFGPEGTPYEGGLFKLFLQFPTEYPRVPPILNFNTSIYHPNVDERGRICISSLNNEWQPEFTASVILSQVRRMLSDPQIEYFLNPSIAVEYQFKKDLFYKTAKEWTMKFAQPIKLKNSVGYFNMNPSIEFYNLKKRRNASLHPRLHKYNSL